jgi:hypothetical protein
MALNNTGKALMLDGFAAAAVFASLHTADPGSGGSNEVTGGTPAYARKGISWAAASGGTKSNSANIVFDVPTSTTITYLGYWSADSGGTFYGGRELNASQTFATQGTYTIATGDLDETIS